MSSLVSILNPDHEQNISDKYAVIAFHYIPIVHLVPLSAWS